jgi:hypothetical protein
VVAESGRALEWTAVPGASGYHLVVGTSPGLGDILDEDVGRLTRVHVANLPVGRRLFARIQTRIHEAWYSRDSDFALQLGCRAARLIHPRPGERANLSRPFRWQSTPLATGYRLRIGRRPGGAELHDSGLVHVTRRFVDSLPAGLTLFATLTTVYPDRSIDHQVEFRAQPGTPTETSYVEAALAATTAVRDMAGVSGAWPRTLLADVVRQQGARVPDCEDFALALLRALTEQRNGLPSRFLGTCLLGNSYDCHTLAELYLPSSVLDGP